MRVTVEASPSLALVKYWGKLEGGVNLAATSSLAVSLDGLRTTTTIADGVPEDRVEVNGCDEPLGPYAGILNAFREKTRELEPVGITSQNNFPTSAGIASSSSGFAAVALGLDALFATQLPRSDLSRIARVGSGSACRAVYGGFTAWHAAADHADPLFPADHWPELRIFVAVVRTTSKTVSSRDGMNHTRMSSPYYRAWVDLSPSLFQSAREALANHDIKTLGTAMRRSYLSMFASMLAADPPLIYWAPESISLIDLCEMLRNEGVEVWETMDAGPQVKLVTTAKYSGQVRQAIQESVPIAEIIETTPGGEPFIGSRKP